MEADRTDRAKHACRSVGRLDLLHPAPVQLTLLPYLVRPFASEPILPRNNKSFLNFYGVWRVVSRVRCFYQPSHIDRPGGAMKTRSSGNRASHQVAWKFECAADAIIAFVGQLSDEEMMKGKAGGSPSGYVGIPDTEWPLVLLHSVCSARTTVEPLHRSGSRQPLRRPIPIRWSSSPIAVAHLTERQPEPQAGKRCEHPRPSF